MSDITVSIGASNATLQTVLSDTQKRLKAMAGGVQSALAPLATLTAPLLGLVGLGAGFAGVSVAIKGVIEKGRQLSELQQRTGQAAGPLIKLQGAFRAARLDADGVGPAINRLQKALAGVNEDGQDTTNVFAKLGLNADSLRKMNSAQQFAQIGAALQRIQDPAARTAAVMQIFGKSGGEMMQLFGDASIVRGLTSSLTTAQGMMAGSVGMFAHISQQWERFIGAAKGAFGLFSGLAAGLAPALVNLVDKLPKIDLSRLGWQLGNLAAIIIQAFSTGDIGTLLGLSLKIGAMQGINYLYAGLRAVFSAAGAYLYENAKAWLSVLRIATTPTFWSGLTHILTSAALSFLSQMIKVGAYLQAGCDYAVNRLTRGVLSLKSPLGEALTFFQSNFVSALLSPVDFLGRKLAETALSFGKAISEGLHGNLSGLKSVVSTMLAGGSLANPAFLISQMFAKSIASGTNSKPAGSQPSFTDFLQKRLAESSDRRNDLDEEAKGEAGKSGIDLKPFLAEAKAQMQSAFSHIAENFSNGWDGGKGPFDASGAEAQFGAIIDKVQAKLAETAASFTGQPGVSGKAAANGPGTNDSGIGQKVGTDTEDQGKNLLDKDKSSASPRSASSLARIGGGGYGAGGLNLQREGNSLLKQIVTNTEQGRKEQKRGLRLGHLTDGATPAATVA